MKKKFLVIGFIFIVSLTCCSECKFAMDYEYPLRLDNNSAYSIDCYFSFSEKIAPFAPNTEPDTIHYLFRGVKPQEYYRYSSSLSWEEKLSYIKSDTISIYIFHTDTLNRYSWKKICEDYLVLKRYDLSLEDLKTLKFKVPYPPSPMMREMKMYPPYKE